MKRLMFYFLTALLLMSTALQAQPIVIEGRLVSKSTHTAVTNAAVLVEGTQMGVASNQSGAFRIKVAALPVTLVISHIGFEKQSVTANRPTLGRIELTPAIITLEEVLVKSTRAVEGETPVAFSTLNREDIGQSYNHQDIPMVLADQPGVYAYSDAGNGVGYTYLKIRGFSQDRIGVFVNGVPLNDPEAHAVYWVDHGDILAATSDIQIQRGVGNALYGTSVFGGAVNLATNFQSLPSGFTATTGYGNFTDKGLNAPSHKYSLSYAGGVWKEQGVHVYGRFSGLDSDGYRFGSGTTQRSFHAGIESNKSTSMTRLEAIWGEEETAFSWEGIIPLYGYDLDDKTDRRYNFYSDPVWNGGRRDANKDVFAQSIVSLQHSRKLGGGLLNLILYNVRGDGYYEQFKGEGDSDDVPDFLNKYNLTHVVSDNSQPIGLIQRKWLKNGYRGGVCQFSKTISKWIVTVGGDARFYGADHFGEVVEIDGGWNVPENHRYYLDESRKNSASVYAHVAFQPLAKMNMSFDAKYLGHRYEFDQQRLGAFQNGYQYKLKYDFLDYHVGIHYDINSSLSVFANAATAHREPADTDIYDHDDPNGVPALKDLTAAYAAPLTKEEFLLDYESGLSLELDRLLFKLNLYRMVFKDELIPVWYRYFDADDVLHANVPKTIHQGVELSLRAEPMHWLSFNSNLSLATNHFVEFRGDSIGWSGYGGVADYSGKTIPAFPIFQAKGKVVVKFGIAESWIQLLHTGKQYIDFANTEEAAVASSTVINLGGSIDLPGVGDVKPRFSFWVNNVFNSLYETFGYNYYDGWPPYRVDAYWPAATRNYYIALAVTL
ncbi:MAG: TonB-dependent receptor [Candidatus Zhuqueibacterota bacterium]